MIRRAPAFRVAPVAPVLALALVVALASPLAHGQQQAPTSPDGPVPQAAVPEQAPAGTTTAPAPTAPAPAVVALPPLPPQEHHSRDFDDMPVAVLGGLDKVTARVTTLAVPVGSSTQFGRLTLTVRACRKAPPIEEPESAAFIEIAESRPDDAPGTPGARVFSGWMFASSPALSALENPVYDVWVVDCRKPGKER